MPRASRSRRSTSAISPRSQSRIASWLIFAARRSRSGWRRLPYRRRNRSLSSFFPDESVTSGRRQVLRRVDRLAGLADLEVQLGRIGVGVAQIGDALAARHVLALLHQDLAVVRVD